MKNITVLLPGGFKPMTGAHVSLIEKYSNNPNVKEVKVIISSKSRDMIDQNLGIKISKQLTKHLSNVIIETSKYPSPILTAYKAIENLPPGQYALGASSKGDDYNRVLDFTTQHQKNGKYYNNVPDGVKIVELIIDSDPSIFLSGPHNGSPISASTIRLDIEKNNFEGFATGYPKNSNEQIKNIWNEIKGINKSIVPKINKHMTHAEDLVLGGMEGIDWILKMMSNLYNEIQTETKNKNTKLSIKIDGAPAIFVWSSFPGLPNNGIAMKGLFANTPKIFTNNDEIDAAVGGRNLLAYKLKTFLKHLPHINIPKGEIWQGDFLFDNKSLQETIIDGKEFWTFHPNTIYYTVPKKSFIGNAISKAEIGITWHTRYTGSNIQNVKANYNIEVTELCLSEKMMMTDPYINYFPKNIKFSKEESEYIEKTMEDLRKYSKELYGSTKYDTIINNKDIIVLFSIFQNYLIKTNIEITDPDDFLVEFREFLQNRCVKEREKLKSEKGKEKSDLKFAGMIDDINKMKETWWILVHIINEITKLKEMFIKKLNTIGKFQTYLKMKDGSLRNTNQEGFAVSDLQGNVVKLVDRKEFSWSNFSPDVQKGWN